MRAALLVCLMLTSIAGCARLNRGSARDTTFTVLSQRREQRVIGELDVQMRQTGSVLEIGAAHVCEDVDIATVERQTAYGLEIASPTVPILLGLGGAAGIGLGVATITNPELLVDSTSSDPESQTLGLQIAGGALTALGTAFLTIVAVDLVRATGSELEHERFEREDSVTRAARCDGHGPVAGERFDLVVGSRGITVGPTDPSGRVVIDLAGALRLSQLTVPVATLRSRGREVGYVDLGPVRATLDERAWSGVSAGRCAETGAASDCAGLIAYLREFPEGNHAGEARAAAELARARIAEQRERIAQEQEAERQRHLEEERRWQAEREAEYRRYEAERQAELERQQRQAAEARAAQLAREQCQSQCRRGCRGAGPECAQACIRSTCR